MKKGRARDIGIDAKPPERVCNDPKCCWHGKLSIRGKILEGVVMSAKMMETAIVRREYFHYDRKYRRYEKRHSSIPAHNPPCINAREGDLVKIGECRPLSKTVSFVIIEKLEK